ncbi:uncharacterized protein [Asterias amurensis]|uniref:uncharacterized protein n=1 Tax=Asterias amurensis TaxID=7602 RepID=UPI003AB7667D
MEPPQDGGSSDVAAQLAKEKNRKSKRAPQQLYVPKARRQELSKESAQNSQQPTEAVEKQEEISTPGVKQHPKKNEKKKGRDGNKGKQRRTSEDGTESGNKDPKEKRNKGKHNRKADLQRYAPRQSKKSTSEEEDGQPKEQNEDAGVRPMDRKKEKQEIVSEKPAENASLIPEDWNEIDCDEKDVTCHPTGTRLTAHGKLILVDPDDETTPEPSSLVNQDQIQETKAKNPESLKSPGDSANEHSAEDNNPVDTEGISASNKIKANISDVPVTITDKSSSAFETSNSEQDGVKMETITNNDAVKSRTIEDDTEVKPVTVDTTAPDTMTSEATPDVMPEQNNQDRVNTEGVTRLSLNEHEPLSKDLEPSIVPPSGQTDGSDKETVHPNASDEHKQELQSETPTTDPSRNEEEKSKELSETDVDKESNNVEEEDVDDWDTMFDESGDCLKQEEIKEITEGVGNVQLTVKQSKRDYYNYQPKDHTDYSEFEHIIEVYDFPVDFKTQDLIMGFCTMKTKEMDIKWVDDTHALAIFPSVIIAQDALSNSNPMFRTRPLMLASRESKEKARHCQEFLRPAKPRPETSTMAARRMVSGALGIKTNVSKEQRAAERQKIKDAKDRRRSDKKQQEDIWDGNI